MNKDTLLKYVFVPAYLLAVITAVRTPLQVMAPDHWLTPLFSSVVPMFLMTLLWPILLQRKGLRFADFLKVFALAIFLVRLPVAAAYALAIGFRWTDPTGEPVRYITDFGDASATMAFFMALGAPLVFMTLVSTVIWTITWAVLYRGKRSWGGAALQG